MPGLDGRGVGWGVPRGGGDGTGVGVPPPGGTRAGLLARGGRGVGVGGPDPGGTGAGVGVPIADGTGTGVQPAGEGDGGVVGAGIADGGHLGDGAACVAADTYLAALGWLPVAAIARPVPPASRAAAGSPSTISVRLPGIVIATSSSGRPAWPPVAGMYLRAASLVA
jgi:hypothetical protein